MQLKTSHFKAAPDSSEDLEVEDNEGDDGDDAGSHQARPVDVESEEDDLDENPKEKVDENLTTKKMLMRIKKRNLSTLI